ncbi:MAG TPA: DNA replication and repair protein RecF, partial [Flavobacteriales bacterium]|nr:DNA replication and repair protein RecF [Flavobacteriales bacterium]
RLAQARLIAEKKGSKPLMLLDDIYDKLDSERMARFLEILKSKNFGQLFITDTNPVHLNSLLASSGMKGKFFKVSKGSINEVSLGQMQANGLNVQ